MIEVTGIHPKMQLKLRVGVGESLTIDVGETDTFHDLSEKLQLAGVQVDLNQLRSEEKPFNMTTNVIQYFTTKCDKPETETEKTDTTLHAPLCRFCCEQIVDEPQYIFEEKEDQVQLCEKITTSLPLNVSKKDHLPKQICGKCYNSLNIGYNFVTKVVKSQKILENLNKVAKGAKADDFCPCCISGVLRKTNDGNKTSQAQPKPPELTLEVQEAIDMNILRNIKKEDVYDTSFYDPVGDSKAPKEYFYDDEVVTEYWDGIIPQDIDMDRPKKFRKRPKVEDDADWTIDQEYVRVSRRGRPKGTRNKKVVQVIEQKCLLCQWTGPHFDVFAHAFNQHCQPDLNLFPCPLCKSKQENEIHLEGHIKNHFEKLESQD